MKPPGRDSTAQIWAADNNSASLHMLCSSQKWQANISLLLASVGWLQLSLFPFCALPPEAFARPYRGQTVTFLQPEKLKSGWAALLYFPSVVAALLPLGMGTG